MSYADSRPEFPHIPDAAKANLQTSMYTHAEMLALLPISSCIKCPSYKIAVALDGRKGGISESPCAATMPSLRTSTAPCLQLFANNPCKPSMIAATLSCALDLSSPILQASNSTEGGEVGIPLLHTINALRRRPGKACCQALLDWDQNGCWCDDAGQKLLRALVPVGSSAMLLCKMWSRTSGSGNSPHQLRKGGHAHFARVDPTLQGQARPFQVTYCTKSGQFQSFRNLAPAQPEFQPSVQPSPEKHPSKGAGVHFHWHKESQRVVKT
eukprot:1144971-Pelagomonas_calceolata.AAC.3